jgi:hypothetical protein
MMITKRGFICLAVGLLAASLFAGHHHRPFPHGTPPNAYWCPKCDGDGYNWTWYGWKKTCGVCDGRGWLVKETPPPPPPPVVAPHHGKPGHHSPKPAPKVAPRPVQGPAPKPAPGPVPKGGPRR